MKITHVASVDDAALTARIRNKGFVKSLKADMRNTLMVSGHHIEEGELITIDQRIDQIVFATLWAIANNKSEEEWRNDIELSLMCLDGFEIDLELLRQFVMTECQAEITILKGRE